MPKEAHDERRRAARQGVSRSTITENYAQFAIANDGTLAYVRGIGDLGARTLAWVDRAGRETPLLVPARSYVYVEISPDGTRLALDIRDQENDTWVYDLERETLQRLTFDPGRNRRCRLGARRPAHRVLAAARR